jgi:glycosyltransferase involved in cell wall biosynthesis
VLAADLYHFHSPELAPWGLLLQATRGVPVVYDSHEYLRQDVATKSWLHPAAAGPLSVLLDNLERSMARRFAGIVTVNPHMAERFRRLNTNVAVVANFPPVEMARHAAAVSQQDRCSAVYLGSIDRDRGFLDVIETMKLIRAEAPAAVMRIYGEIEDGTHSQHAVPATDADLLSIGIETFPRVPHGSLREVVGHCAVGWVPWRATAHHVLGTPTKIFEYMALGLPVVASDLPFVKTIVEENECGVVVPAGSPVDHARALLELWNDPARARGMGERGRLAVLARLNWESQFGELLALYDRALAMRRCIQ